MTGVQTCALPISTGLKTYFPNFDISLFNGVERDSIKVSWEQNLYKQMLYSNVSFLLPDRGFYTAALRLYPSPSRLFALEATMFRKEGGDFIFGGGIEIPFVRLAYNSASDVENFFGSHGTFMVEIRFSISSIRNQFFGLNAAKALFMDYEPQKTVAPKGVLNSPPKPAAIPIIINMLLSGTILNRLEME